MITLSLDLMLLRAASCLVPRAQRAEWLAEWRSELWYVQHARHQKPRVGATAFCLGAFQDAFWFRWNVPRTAPGLLRRESPLQCLLFLAVLALGSLLLAFCLPVARDLFLPSPYRNQPGLVMISTHRRSAAPAPTIPIEQYQVWANDTYRRFTGQGMIRNSANTSKTRT